MKKFTSKKQKIGEIGERIAELFLVKLDYVILGKNYSSRFGEIDIIATKNERIYFFEVKAITVTHETVLSKRLTVIEILNNLVTHETNIDYVPHVPDKNPIKSNVSRDTFIRENRKLSNPFQNITYFKSKRLLKTVELYMSFMKVSPETKWQVDGIGVLLDMQNKKAYIEHLPHITII